VQTHADDESFEIYLKQFVPRAPGALRAVTRERQTRRALALGLSAAIIFFAAALLATNWTAKRSHSSADIGNWSAPQATDFHPLTIHTADELLARTPSLKAATDELMLDSEKKAIPESQSAFKALSEENVIP